MSTSRILVKMEPRLDSLPPEVISQIFSSLSFNDSKHVRQVSKQWKDIFDQLSFRDQQQIFFKLFNDKIDISAHKNFQSFLDSLKKLSASNIEDIIKNYQIQQNALAKKQFNRKLRSICCSPKTFHCCSAEETREAQEAELLLVDKIFITLPFALLGFIIGILLFVGSIAFHIDSATDPAIFASIGILSVFFCPILCVASSAFITHLSTNYYPAIVGERATSSSRRFLEIFNQENGTDTVVDIANLLRNSYEHESHAGQNGCRN